MMSHQRDRPRVYVLLLNWNGWGNSLHCLESIFRLNTPGVHVIVCDNASGDGSMDHIEAWAKGCVDVVPERAELRHLSHPPVPKPIPYRCYDRVQAERGGDPDDHSSVLTLIQTGANLGYGGGNNVGLRYALSRGVFDYLWFLNNDTLVVPDALDVLLERMAGTDIGMCGSTLLFHDRPDSIQCQAGASFYRWLGLSRLLGIHRPLTAMATQLDIERRLDHLYGASMLVSWDCLQALGPMAEDYFLYYEEMDWITRAPGRVRLGYAPNSIVYHRKGGAAGTATRHGGRGTLATYYLARSRIRYVRRHFPIALPMVYGLISLELMVKAMKGDWRRARVLLDVLSGSDRNRPSDPDARDIPHSDRQPGRH